MERNRNFFVSISVDGLTSVVFFQMCAETQSLIVKVVKGGHKVNLTMTFPVTYPNRVSPEFYLSEDTTFNQIEKRKLVEVISSLCNAYV